MEDTGQDRAKGVEPPKLQDASPKKTDLPTIAPKPDDQGWQSHESPCITTKGGTMTKGARGTPFEDSSFSEHLKN
jgi:hypothetical protein